MADAAAGEGGKKKKEVVSKSARAGLTFAVSRIDKKLRHARIAKQIGTASSVFLTGAVEHVVEHVLKKADEEASARKSKRVTEQHIIAAVRSDPDLARAFLGFCFSSDADVPKAIDHILPQNEQAARKEKQKTRKATRAGAGPAAAEAAREEADAALDD